MTQQMTQTMASLVATDDYEDDDIQQIYPEDSLDRFGDDLFGILLSHLSLKDRLRFECVSKQFQRTVFESVVNIKIDDKLILEENTTQLFPTFGPLVTRIKSVSLPERQSLIHCHRLSHLRIYSLYDIFDTTSGQSLAKNLQKFEFTFSGNEDKEVLSPFVAQNQSLKNIKIIDKNSVIPGNFPELSQQLSRLPELRELTLFSTLNNQNSLNEFLRTIGLNCKQMKRLTLQLMSNNTPLNGQTLDSLRVYQRLKRLDLTIGAEVEHQFWEPLKLCHRLTHLTLYSTQMSDNFLDNCGKHWPRLHFLYIRSNEITDKCLDNISRLPALQILIFTYIKAIGLRDSDFEDLLTKNMTQMMASLETTDDGEGEDRQQPQIYAKDSLDRFGDDLCQLLLSYLSLGDRFRCECVSKQFRRTVFTSVVHFNITAEPIKRNNYSKTPIFTIMQIMAKKCPNIESIDFRGVINSDEYILEVFPVFRDKFPKLREIYCDLVSNSGRWVRELAPLITRVKNSFTNSKSLIDCHRLSHLNARGLLMLFDNNSEQLLIHNLLKIQFNYSNDSQLLSRFVSGNESIKCVEITHFGDNGLTEMCAQLSRLPQLRRLRLGLFNYDNSLAAALHTIGLNCKQLKRLSLGLYTNETKESDLKTLDQLTVCRRLTHLFIRLTKMDTNLLSICDKQWPRLHYLHIVDANNAIDIQCLSHLSRLPALQMLVIQCNQDIDLKDNDFENLLSRSPKLKNIKIIIIKASVGALDPLKVFDLLIPAQSLTHLTLECWQMDCKLLGNDTKHWPPLKYLNIKCHDFNGQCLSHISRLPALNTLIISAVNESSGLSYNDFNDLLSRSPKLKNIEFTVNV
ncbi:unnamed protein product [Medioppia subpectinata]|uniref:F-box domain-containing protein n=1 Tax=Medioppia subpectinata TaxID=1979941 RepID=A0A7R9KCY3_9ACAR|nr:unnamed protein product [Medioppia subpectinata]CAG2100931.1 unnamed protein product [Medioppia subpectinata]